MTIASTGVLRLEVALLILYGIIMLFKKVNISKILFRLSLGLYIALIIAYCVFPISIGYIEMQISVKNNYIPFKTIAESISSFVTGSSSYALKMMIGNLLLLTPASFFLTVLEKNLKSRLLDVFLISVGIETVQYAIGLLIGYNYRSVDIDDVILNSLGGIISCVIVSIIAKRFQNKQHIS